MKISVEQENTIVDFVNKQGLSIPSLADDLIDHLCCVVESELGKGKSFELILENAINDIAPNGLIDIQNKTIFLLKSKRIIIMKKLMYSIGLIGSILLTIGVTLKILQQPFANILFISGFLILLLIFIPLMAIDRYKVTLSKSISIKLKVGIGVAAAIITGLAGLFKLMHWQGANVLLVTGAFIFAFGYLPFFFFNMYKKSIS